MGDEVTVRVPVVGIELEGWQGCWSEVPGGELVDEFDWGRAPKEVRLEAGQRLVVADPEWWPGMMVLEDVVSAKCYAVECGLVERRARD